MSEAEAMDEAHQSNLISAERARHRLAQDVRQLERIGRGLVHTGERKLKAGLIVLATFGGLLLGLLFSIALRRKS